MSGAYLSDWLREIIRCPACHGELADATTPDDTGSDGQPELVCSSCQLGYPVRDGIPVLLAAAATDRS